MTYAASIRRKLESAGYEVTETETGDLVTVRAEKDGSVHQAAAENLTVAFLEVERSVYGAVLRSTGT